MTDTFNWPGWYFVTVDLKEMGRMGEKKTKHNDAVLEHKRKKDQNPLAGKPAPSETHPAQQTPLN